MTYDLIVIGAGSGGLNIASFMNKAGFKVLLVDKADKNIGGDCLNTGCIPSKALIHCAKLAHSANEASNFGYKVSGKADIKKIKSYINEKIEFIRKHENAAWFRKQGMDVVLGEAKFNSKKSIIVKGKEYHAKNIILATGSRPRKLKITGSDKVEFYSSENIWTIDKIPKNFLFIGGGPISTELGQSFQRLGSQVTILTNTAEFLPKEEPEIRKVLQEQLLSEGMKFHFSSNPVEFKNKNELIFEQNGKKKNIKFDAVFLGIGRELNYQGLDLEKAGIKVHERGIFVNNYLQTTNKNVYLCGDIAGGFQFTHACELQTSTIIKNLFSPIKTKLTYDNFSWVTYTYPEIATFGINEKEMKKRGLNYKRLVLDHTDDDRAIVDQFQDGKSIIYVDNKDKLLGGTIISPNAGEVFQEFVLAKTNNLSISSFLQKIYAYPTASRINKKIITNLFAKKLTPFAKKVLRWMY